MHGTSTILDDEDDEIVLFCPLISETVSLAGFCFSMKISFVLLLRITPEYIFAERANLGGLLSVLNFVICRIQLRAHA